VTLSDERLRQLAAETLELARSGREEAGATSASGEDRIAALEARVRRLEAALGAAAPVAAAAIAAPVQRIALPMLHAHPHVHGAAGHQYGLPPAMGERCVLEPGSPCVGHGTCKSHGY
jgi:hypothetical protein